MKYYFYGVSISTADGMQLVSKYLGHFTAFTIFIAISQAESQRPGLEYSFVVSCRVEPSPFQIRHELPG